MKIKKWKNFIVYGITTIDNEHAAKMQKKNLTNCAMIDR